MTLVVGILCTDGVVIGTDSAITQRMPNQTPTTEQPDKEKIKVIDGQVIVAGAGEVGLGQRFENVVREKLNSPDLRNSDPVKTGNLFSRKMISDVVNTNPHLPNPNLPLVNYGALMAFPCKEEFVLAEFELGSFQLELKTMSSWYVSLGAGKGVADPLLGFMRKVFWGDSPPTLQEGVFASTFVLTLGCWMAPGGVSEPIQIAVLKRNGSDNIHAQRISQEEQYEHQMYVRDAIKYFGKYDKHLVSQSLTFPELSDKQ